MIERRFTFSVTERQNFHYTIRSLLPIESSEGSSITRSRDASNIQGRFSGPCKSRTRRLTGEHPLSDSNRNDPPSGSIGMYGEPADVRVRDSNCYAVGSPGSIALERRRTAISDAV